MPIENKPAPNRFVEPPLPGPLAGGVALIPYRLENLRIMSWAGCGTKRIVAVDFEGRVLTTHTVTFTSSDK